MVDFTKAELVQCVERELQQRSRVYARRIQEKKMSRVFADEEIAKMRGVLAAILAYVPDAPPKQGGLFE